MGMANKFSIAYGIAGSLKNQGAALIFTAQSERFKEKISDTIAEFSKHDVFVCDVTNEGEIERVFKEINDRVGNIDFLVHSIAFSDKNELRGQYSQTTRENFLNTLNISCYSLTEICRFLPIIMKDGGSVLTLTYYGSEKVVPNYNVMAVAKSALETSVKYLANDLGEYGIRVNAISAGPIKTLAASGIHEFSKILELERDRAPLKRNVTQKDIGDACSFLISDMASGITGQILHVDCGSSIVGMTI
ncbi:enoyl-[acyl-carrier-protein] reductase [NADH] FabI [Alphaproteobacteria bacterium]|nr:enoyl-[acyl-carrier-protein] reductase [NADH] FabI [Alphaproteobacteria bacterium]